MNVPQEFKIVKQVLIEQRWMHAYMYIHKYIYAYICIHMHTHTYIYTHTQIHICIYLYTNMHGYIYICIYCHPLIDCSIVSQLFSVFRRIGRLKLGSKPAQLYVRFSIIPLSEQGNHTSSEIIRHICEWLP